MEGFWIFQDPEYARFLHIQGLHKVMNMPEHGWIMPAQTVLAKFSICQVNVSQGFEYASGSKCTWIWLSNISVCMNVP